MSAGALHIASDPADPMYAEIVARDPHAMIYQTPAYLRYLSAVLAQAELRLVVLPGAAAMPVFVSHTANGTVVNALPYYGSHGDLVCVPEAGDTERMAVLAAFAELCRNVSADAVNIVGHPLRPIAAPGGALGLSRWDERDGHVSLLNAAQSRAQALEATLAAANGKTRNLARKGLAQGFDLTVSDDERDWKDLAFAHRQTIDALGGVAKPYRDFEQLRAGFGQCGAARLYVARADGGFVGGLLMLRHQDWVEYFTPVSIPEFRSAQVVPALIATAMTDARMDGTRYWNWGGTWKAQDGVRHFKEGWGARTYPYGYFGAMLTDRFKGVAPDALSAWFPRFYVRPYSKIA